MRWIFLLSALFIFSSAGSGLATTQTLQISKGYDLVRACRINQSVTRSGGASTNVLDISPMVSCSSFFQASHGLHDLLVKQGKMKPFLCIPEQVNVWQKVDVFLKWADENPVQLHKPSSELWFTAFRDAFPCPK